MQEFIKRYECDVIGVLSGWDRIRFLGTYRVLMKKRIESGFRNTKENKGFRRLLLRGIRGVEIEMMLDAIEFNLEKIAAK